MSFTRDLDKSEVRDAKYDLQPPTSAKQYQYEQRGAETWRIDNPGSGRSQFEVRVYGNEEKEANRLIEKEKNNKIESERKSKERYEELNREAEERERVTQQTKDAELERERIKDEKIKKYLEEKRRTNPHPQRTRGIENKDIVTLDDVEAEEKWRRKQEEDKKRFPKSEPNPNIRRDGETFSDYERRLKRERQSLENELNKPRPFEPARPLPLENPLPERTRQPLPFKQPETRKPLTFDIKLPTAEDKANLDGITKRYRHLTPDEVSKFKRPEVPKRPGAKTNATSKSIRKALGNTPLGKAINIVDALKNGSDLINEVQDIIDGGDIIGNEEERDAIRKAEEERRFKRDIEELEKLPELPPGYVYGLAVTGTYNNIDAGFNYLTKTINYVSFGGVGELEILKYQNKSTFSFKFLVREKEQKFQAGQNTITLKVSKFALDIFFLPDNSSGSTVEPAPFPLSGGTYFPTNNDEPETMDCRFNVDAIKRALQKEVEVEIYDEKKGKIVKQKMIFLGTTETMKSIQQCFHDLAEIRNSGTIATTPEKWKTELPDERPQMAIIYRSDEEGTGNYQLVIPHCIDQKSNKPSFPKYKKGSTSGVLQLKDGSRIVVNASDAKEAERVVNALKKYVVASKLSDATFTTFERRGTKVKDGNMTAIRADYYPKGMTEATPSNRYYL